MEKKTLMQSPYIDLEKDPRIHLNRRRLSFYFPINSKLTELVHFKPKNPSNLKLTYEGVYSITRPEQGAQFLRLFKAYTDQFKDCTLVDGTAGLGGDLIYIGGLFKKCIAFEINPDHANAIESNTSEYGIDCKVHNRDFTLEYKNVLDSHTVLWLDPPWGGPDKWKEDNLKLYFYGSSNIYVNDFIDECFKCDVQMIILKCPIKTYIDDLRQKYKIIQHPITRFSDSEISGNLFQLVIIEKKSGGRAKPKPKPRARSRSRSKTKKTTAKK